jgi:hypothetical protein
MMQAYESDRFDPPAPLAFVTVKAVDSDLVIHGVPMLLDTGADVSLLPRPSIEALVSPNAEEWELQGFDGTKSTSSVVRAELQFLGKSFRGEFLLVDGWHGVLGRNVLNNLRILFDGPSQTWAEQK